MPWFRMQNIQECPTSITSKQVASRAHKQCLSNSVRLETAVSDNDDMTPYFSAKKLFGDDFDLAEIRNWYKDEAEGYANLGAKRRETYRYSYHAMNWWNGYRYIKRRHFEHALGIGSAYGDELIPITGQISRISIVDSSDAFIVTDIEGTPVSYVKAEETGDLPFADNTFDLVTCFGVLHHIPNVSHVVSEMYRCMVPGGIALIREPNNSMGDWRKPRRGLTRRERGIPDDIMRAILVKSGFTIDKVSHCFFPLIPRIYRMAGIAPYNSKVATLLDRGLSVLMKWNCSYHRQSILSKFAPSSVFWVIRK